MSHEESEERERKRGKGFCLQRVTAKRGNGCKGVAAIHFNSCAANPMQCAGKRSSEVKIGSMGVIPGMTFYLWGMSRCPGSPPAAPGPAPLVRAMLIFKHDGCCSKG